MSKTHPFPGILLAAFLCGMLFSLTPADAQTCPFSQQCGKACCTSNQLCHLNQCINPGAVCAENGDCTKSEYCSLSAKRCVPLSKIDAACTYRPPTGQFSPTILWEWFGGTTEPTWKNVMMTPVVMALQDTNNNGAIDVKDIPSVIFMSFLRGYTLADPGYLRAVRGDNGKEIFTNTKHVVNALGSLAVGDINNDGKPEIIAPRYSGTQGDIAGGLYAFSNTGQLLWESHDKNGKLVPLSVGWGGASLADLDADGKPEVIVGAAVVRGSDGLVLCQGTKGVGSLSNGSPVSIAVDLNNDGKLEIVTGNTAYKHDCSILWSNTEQDGYPAVADITGDGKPEVVVISPGELRVQEGATGKVLMRITVPSIGSRDRKKSGPPTIADLNGDGLLDITTAGFSEYYVYTTDPARKQLKLLWKFKTNDTSSGSTGSSIFDFEGDGKAEVLYNDEDFLRVFNGNNGKVLSNLTNPSGTALEYPLVVDVNNDGRAEVVVCSNINPRIVPPTMPTLRVYRDKLDNWVGTRNVWNQHAYHVTNICTGDAFCPAGNKFGQIPTKPLANWKVSELNNFRQNIQGKATVFQASDLLIKGFNVRVDGCTGDLQLSFWLVNQGTKKIPKDIPVTLYTVIAGKKTALKTLISTRELAPGEAERFNHQETLTAPYPTQLIVHADDDGQGQNTRNECDKKNNELLYTFKGIYCGEPPPSEEPKTEPTTREETPQEPPREKEPVSEPQKDAGVPEPLKDTRPADQTNIKDKSTGQEGDGDSKESKIAPGCNCNSLESSSSSVFLMLFLLCTLFFCRRFSHTHS